MSALLATCRVQLGAAMRMALCARGGRDQPPLIEWHICTSAPSELDPVVDARSLLHRPPLETPADSAVVAALIKGSSMIRGRDAAVSGPSYWADSAFIAEAGIPTVLFGPSGEGAHADTGG